MTKLLSALLFAAFLCFVGCTPQGETPEGETTQSEDTTPETTMDAMEPTAAETVEQTAEEPVESSENPELAALREGGFVVYLRHTETDASPFSADADGHLDDLSDCSLQRNLTDAGRRDAREIGRDVERLGIPVGEVFASPYCRTRESAELAFGEATLVPELATPRYLAPDDPENEARNEYLRNLFSTPPDGGENDFVLTHELNLRLVSGESVPEGGAVVFEPRGDGFDVLEVLPPEWWREAG